MRIVFGIIIGLLVGGFVGYMVGIYVACELIPNPGNLCGLVGVFITGPLGAIGGGFAGGFLSRKRPLQ